MENHKIIYYILGILIFIILVYIVVGIHNRFYANKKENFVALSGIEGPLTTYDGYGTFNFIFNLDDLPYYDPTYWNESCLYPDIDPLFQPKAERCGNINFNKSGEITNINEQVYILTRPTRREVVPSNYTDHADLSDAEHTSQRLLIKKDRTRASRQPPQPKNYYFQGYHPKAELHHRL